MSNSNLTIDLTARKDKDNRVYYVGRLKIDAQVDFKDGVVFLVFTADQGAEQLQLCPMSRKEQED